MIARHPQRFKLLGMAAGENIDLVKKQIKSFSPKIVSVKRKEDADELKKLFPEVKVINGNSGLMDVVSFPGVDTMVSAIDGTTSLEATLLSIKNNHRICLANKETLVAAGELINNALENSNAELIPIDSEQSAIFQCIGNCSREFIHKVILTASGGPFFKKDRNEFDTIGIKDALAHPTWSMGTKVTLDSATLMNKALEVIEAFHLFKLQKNQIDVVIHPQSIIHSMVEFIDSSVMAQLSVPDMKLPILYSLSYPERITWNNNRLNFTELNKLEFYRVDMEKFPSIRMAYDVLEIGKNSGAVLNAANEIAVDYFLKEKISFKDIFTVVAHIFYNQTFHRVHSLDDIDETISEIKRKTTLYIEEKIKN